MAVPGTLHIVTDGLVDLFSPLEKRPSLSIVPWQVETKGRKIPSDQLSPERLELKGGFRLSPPSHHEFLQTYQHLGRDGHILSIHLASSLHPISHEARVARHLLHPQGNILTYEARAINLGLSYLVDVAAQTAQEDSLSLAQMLQVLSRLQDQAVHTLILAGPLGPLTKRAPVSLGKRFLDSWPGIDSLVAFDGRSARFRILAQARRFAKRWDGWEDVLRFVERPCELWIRERGYEKVIEAFRDRVASVLDPEKIRLESSPINVSPFVGNRYLEMCIYPTPERLERMVAEARGA